MFKSDTKVFLVENFHVLLKTFMCYSGVQVKAAQRLSQLVLKVQSTHRALKRGLLWNLRSRT